MWKKMKVKEIKNSTYIYHPNSKGTSTNVRCIPKKKMLWQVNVIYDTNITQRNASVYLVVMTLISILHSTFE